MNLIRSLNLVVILLIYSINVFSQTNDIIAFTGKISLASSYRNAITSIDIKIDSILSGRFDSLDCKKLVRITNIPFSDKNSLHITDSFLLYLNSGSSKKVELLDQSQTYLFLVKDSILGWNEISKDTSQGFGFNVSTSVHDCYYPSYSPQGTIWCLNKSITKINQVYYDHKGVGNDTIIVDLDDRIAPDLQFEASFYADKIPDEFMVVEKLGGKVLYSSGIVEGNKHNVRIPLAKTESNKLQIIVISTDKRSKWRIRYRLMSEIW